jgi:hypothetical protein
MHSDLGSDNSENEMSVEEVNIKIKQKHKSKQKVISMIKTMAGTLQVFMCCLLLITVTAWADICNIETRCYISVFMGRHLQSQINMLSLGQLSPSTINPRQSKKLLLDIKLKLPKTLTLPDDPDKILWYFYRQLTSTAIMENKRNVVAISVPLLDLKGQFEINNIFNLPLII